MIRTSILIVLCTVLFFPSNAHFMSRVWPQKKLDAGETGSPEAPVRLLIAGKKTPFRDTVIARLVDKLRSGSRYFRLIDLKELSKQNARDWNAILLVNRCVAFNYDNLARNYLRKNSDYPHFVVFTTSADPRGCRIERKQHKKRHFDAFTSASQDDRIGDVVDTLYNLLKKHLEQE